MGYTKLNNHFRCPGQTSPLPSKESEHSMQKLPFEAGLLRLPQKGAGRKRLTILHILNHAFTSCQTPSKQRGCQTQKEPIGDLFN
eukprot:1160534-Pelagomonas_calceolata.AAC.7